ncbi:uncharacterized protein LOC127833375 isoform X2 [Dreissena polymorpha]|uniref:uncharacterized protein LOC127833375 isoform X2 n=1 Tax=Dreissena polymorpha TaxID=45954 RepID=UPI0022647554|nr:uncharacterized protein LOC127833375 isoform X2 [Dreissena polymorpha]
MCSVFQQSSRICEMFCLEHGHVGCNISDISTEYDGDTWKCSIPVDDLRRESNSVDVSSYGTPATPKQVITTLSASRLTSKSPTTEQFNYTEMDSMTTQDVGTISADMFPIAADIVGPAVTALIVLDIGLILCVFRVKKSTCLRGQRDVRIELPIQEMRRNTINLDVAEGFYTNIVRTTHLGHNPENPEDLHFASRETPVVYSDVAHKKTKQDRNDGGGPV